MSLFIADKLAWDQKGTPPFYNDVKGALLNSLEDACLQYIAYVSDNNLLLNPHKWLLEAKAFLENDL